MLDEADIVEAFIRHNSHYVKHHVIIDNGSTDGTLEILHSLKNEGVPLSLYKNNGISFSEQSFMTFLYERAVEDHGADWIVCLDCDEFIDDRAVPGGLAGVLSNVRSDAPAIKMAWHQYFYTKSDDYAELITPKRITRRLPGNYDSKVIVRGNLVGHDVVMDNGCHDVFIDGSYHPNVKIIPDIYLAHYSERNTYQTIVKFVRGWVKAKAADQPTRDRGVATHYRGPFEALRDRPQELLRNEWYMTGKNEGMDLIEDPIEYKGGALRYSSNIDPAMLATRSLAGYMEALADRHALLIDTFPEVKEFVERKNKESTKIF